MADGGEVNDPSFRVEKHDEANRSDWWESEFFKNLDDYWQVEVSGFGSIGNKFILFIRDD